jgi:hypothetical protein
MVRQKLGMTERRKFGIPSGVFHKVLHGAGHNIHTCSQRWLNMFASMFFAKLERHELPTALHYVALLTL